MKHKTKSFSSVLNKPLLDKKRVGDNETVLGRKGIDETNSLMSPTKDKLENICSPLYDIPEEQPRPETSYSSRNYAQGMVTIFYRRDDEQDPTKSASESDSSNCYWLASDKKAEDQNSINTSASELELVKYHSDVQETEDDIFQVYDDNGNWGQTFITGFQANEERLTLNPFVRKSMGRVDVKGCYRPDELAFNARFHEDEQQDNLWLPLGPNRSEETRKNNTEITSAVTCPLLTKERLASSRCNNSVSTEKKVFDWLSDCNSEKNSSMPPFLPIINRSMRAQEMS